MPWATTHLCLPKRLSSASGLVSGPAVGPVGTTETLIWPNSCVCCPQSPQLPELDRFHLWEHSLSTQIFHRCRVYLGDRRDLIYSLYSWWKDFRSSSLVSPSLGFSFGFIPTSVCCPPTGVWSWGCLGVLGSATVRTGCRGGMTAWIVGALAEPNAQGTWRPWVQGIYVPFSKVLGYKNLYILAKKNWI